MWSRDESTWHGSGPAMATSFAWISVLAKRADQVVKGREILKCSWEDTFGSLLLRFGDEMKAEKISHVISKSKKFIDPCHKVPVDAPVTLCDQFGCNNVCIYLEVDEAAKPTPTRTVASVY